MNQMLQDFARQYLKDGLELLPAENLRVFALMYGRKNGTRSTEDAIAMPLASIVDQMPVEQLDTAMDQVKRTIEKRNKTALERSTQP